MSSTIKGSESWAAIRPPAKHPLAALCLSQLRTGTLGFGGPIATMSMMGDELSDRLNLVTRRRWQEGMALVKLMPGPVSSLLAIFLGQEVAGTVGGLLSVFCFVLPSFLMLLAVCYFERALGPWLQGSLGFHRTLDLLQASVLAVIAHTCWKLFRDAHRTVVKEGGGFYTAACFALFGVALVRLAKLPEPAVLALVGLMGLLWSKWRRPRKGLAVDPLTLFWAFSFAGTTVWGTGYMVLPYLHRVLVENNGWLSGQDFSSSVVYGNLTPGPIVIASTYMGFKMAGLGGAMSSTLGIFAGPTVLMLALGPWVRRYLDRAWVKGVLLGILPAVAATIAAGLPSLGANLAWNALQIFVAIATLLLSLRAWPVWKIFAGTALLGALIAYVPVAQAEEPAPVAEASPSASAAPRIELPKGVPEAQRIKDCPGNGRLETRKFPFKLNDVASEVFEQACLAGPNRHGPTRRWYATGQIYHDFLYEKGEPRGLWQSYYPDAKPMMRGEFSWDPVAKKPSVKGQKTFYADGRVACEYEGVLDPALQAKTSKVYSQNGRLLPAGEYFALCGGSPQGIAKLLCEQRGHCDAVVLVRDTSKRVGQRQHRVTIPKSIPPRRRSY